jgi:hypothetical protein
VTSSRERDQAIERVLREPASSADVPSDSCLDAEAMAAMMAGGLSGTALTAAQDHVAGCARCQQLLAALARIDVPDSAGETTRARWGWLVWAAPLAAAAAVLAVWVAVPNRPSAPPTPVDSIGAPQSSAPPSSAAAADATSIAQLPSQAPQRTADNSPRRSEPSIGPDNRLKKDSAVARQSKNENDAGADRAAKPLERRDAPLSEQKVAAPSAMQAAPAAAPAPAPAASAKSFDAQKSLDRFADVAVVIASTDPKVLWRIVGSAVQRSADAGATWDTQSTGSAVPLVAGAAASPSICWIVGRQGTVLVSIDGRTWRRVPFPETTDLSAVRAKDASSASVTTADGRIFSTIDAGATWTPGSLQDF